MVEFIENQAQMVVTVADETFEQYAKRIGDAKVPIQYKDGRAIELRPDLEYSFLMLGLKKLATPEQFGILASTIMAEVQKLESQGVLPEDWVQQVATPFDVVPPQLREEFLTALDADIEIVISVNGYIGLDIQKKYMPQPEPDETAEEWPINEEFVDEESESHEDTEKESTDEEETIDEDEESNEDVEG
jgi:hypothetical protein